MRPARGRSARMTRDASAVLLRDAHPPSRSSPAPLWLQMKQTLEAIIRNAELPPDAPLPSEADLCGLFKVSRPVVRAALDALSAEGFVVKQTRRGTFVSSPRNELDFAATNVGLFGELVAKGYEVKTRMLRLARRRPTAPERAMLRLAPGADVVHLDRLYFVDGKPMALGAIALPEGRVPGLEHVDLTDTSLYAMLRERYGLIVAKSERWLAAVQPTAEQSRLMQMAEPAPVIAIESLGWLADGTPIEYYNAIYATGERRIHLVTRQLPGAPRRPPAAPTERGA